MINWKTPLLPSSLMQLVVACPSQSFGSVSLSRPRPLPVPPLRFLLLISLCCRQPLIQHQTSWSHSHSAMRSSHTVSELSIYHCRFQKSESMFLRTLVRADMEVYRVIPSRLAPDPLAWVTRRAAIRKHLVVVVISWWFMNRSGSVGEEITPRCWTVEIFVFSPVLHSSCGSNYSTLNC